jgi:hypothetical protein
MDSPSTQNSFQAGASNGTGTIIETKSSARIETNNNIVSSTDNYKEL